LGGPGGPPPGFIRPPLALSPPPWPRALAWVGATGAPGLPLAAAAKARGLAEAEAAKAKGLAEAESARAKGLAEADAIKARAAALAENQEAVVAQQLAERWPEIVEAGASAFGNVAHMVVLNGAEGMSDMFAKALSLGGTGLGLARQLMDAMAKPAEKELEKKAVSNGELKLTD